MMNIIEQIENKILDEMEYLEDAWEIQNEINELYSKNKITKSEWEHLQDWLLSETQYKDFDLVGIDDYDWELMKEFDSNLSEQ